MSSAGPLALPEDYETRYGRVDASERPRVAALLADASALLLARYRESEGREREEGDNPSFDANACAVCCAMVSRALCAPSVMAGATQVSQTAGSYSASATLAGPTGDLYVSRGDLARLGLGRQRIWSIRPRTAADGEGDACV